MSLPVPNSPQQLAEMVTATTTVTVTATKPLPTRTIGRPWTTASPRIYTMTQPHYTEVQMFYPLQPTSAMYRPCPRRSGAIAGSFFGGLGLGLIILGIVVLVLCRKIHRLKKILRRAESGLYTIPVDSDKVVQEAVVAGSRGGSQIESQPLLRESRTLIDVEAMVSGK
jgi:hypothetical protein